MTAPTTPDSETTPSRAVVVSDDCSAFERLAPTEWLPHWSEGKTPETLYVEATPGNFREFRMSPGRVAGDFAYPIYRLKQNGGGEVDP